MKNPRRSPIRRPAGAAVKGRDSSISPPDRPRFGEIADYLARWAQFRTSWICRRLRRTFRKSRKISAVHGSAAPPVLRRMGGIREIPTRPSEIRRNRHSLGAVGRNYAPRGSAADCVKSSGNPENLRRSRGHRPAGSAAKGGPKRILARQTEIRRNRHILGAIGAISHLMDLRSIV